MIVDAHQHVYWHRRDAAGLIRDMDEHGIDTAWIMTWEIPPDQDTPQFHHALNPEHIRADGTHRGIVLADILRGRDAFPDRLGVIGYCPDPRLPNAPQLFEAAVHMHGVRLCAEWKFRLLLDDPRCINLFRMAGRLGCPVTFHIDIPFMPNPEGPEARYATHWYGGTVDNLARALDACPQTTFIGHAPGFWRELACDADTAPEMYPDGEFPGKGRLYELFDNHPNLMADLSAESGLCALRRSTEHATAFLTHYADRLVFGRDQYGGELLECLSQLELPNDVREKIMVRNAQALMDLQAQAVQDRP
jgi:predicted TIM-barrel fold metal-dependent hydrolase